METVSVTTTKTTTTQLRLRHSIQITLWKKLNADYVKKTKELLTTWHQDVTFCWRM